MRIAAAQLNQTVGDFRGNVQRIIAAAREAQARGARILVTPELSICGYPPEDLLLRDSFQRGCNDALDELRRATEGLDLHVLVGHPLRDGSPPDGSPPNGSPPNGSPPDSAPQDDTRRGGPRRYNAASLLHGGRVLGIYRKRELPNYAVFDEQRYFARGDDAFVFDVDGLRFGVAICEDIWFREAPRAARAAGARTLLVLNASPYHRDKQHQRLDTARAHVSGLGLPMLAANLVGGQDELVFDGLSFALKADGTLAGQATAFAPDLLLVDIGAATPAATSSSATASAGNAPDFEPGAIAPPQGSEEQIYSALVLGVRDYIGKNGFPGAIVGLSGGVDSALVLAIAVDALGADKVRAVMMPSPYTADISWIDAREMAGRLGVRYDELPIGGCFDAFRATLADGFRGMPEDATEENLQARIRGTLLMALSNKFGQIVLTTGNKSELAVGYCTLYGDMAGGFAVIKDILKTTVWRLCHWRNHVSPVIPERIITRPPSAELRAGQTDQDSLPPYETLDAIVAMYMEQDRGADEIVAAGHPAEAVERVLRLIRVNEYKRRQAPIGIRVTHRAFGRDWRYPITSGFRN